MTDAEWLKCRTWESVFQCFTEGLSGRKLHLFACACCRRIWHLMHEESRTVVELAERRADGLIEKEQVRQAVEESQRAKLDAVATNAVAAVCWFTDDNLVRGVHMTAGNAACCVAMTEVPGTRRTEKWEAAKEQEEAKQAAAFLEITGNPFRPVSVDPDWLTPNTVALAQAAYDQRELPSGHLELARLAAVADALEEAGCDSADILAHLRSPGPHVRGCWVVDLILGKT